MQAKERKETARMSWMLEDLCPGAGAAGVDGGERERERNVLVTLNWGIHHSPVQTYIQTRHGGREGIRSASVSAMPV